MQTNKPLPHLTIRSGPWAGTMVRFATVEQLRCIQGISRKLKIPTWETVALFLPLLNAPQPKES